MKKFILILWNFLLSIFKTKKQLKPLPVVRTYEKEKTPEPIKVKGTAHIGIRSYPKHNNRGKGVQYVFAEGSSKPIYH